MGPEKGAVTLASSSLINLCLIGSAQSPSSPKKEWGGRGLVQRLSFPEQASAPTGP